MYCNHLENHVIKSILWWSEVLYYMYISWCVVFDQYISISYGARLSLSSSLCRRII